MNKEDPKGETRVRAAVDLGGIPQAIKQSVKELSRPTSADEVIAKISALIGEALMASRITLFQNKAVNDGRIEAMQRYAWQAEHVATANGARAPLSLSRDSGDLANRLAHNEPVVVNIDIASETMRQALLANGVTAAVFVPIFIGDSWWGEAEIDRCDAQAWSEAELHACGILGPLIAAAIVRAEATKELADASRLIANSATILFRFSAQAPYAISYISNNVARYGYVADNLLASPLRHLELTHPEDLPKEIEDIERVATGATSGTSRDLRLRAADGRYVWFEVRMSAVRDKSGLVAEIEGLAIDVDRRKTTESYIVRFRLTDQLTGLPNRTAFLDELRHAFVAAKRGAKPFAILYIDLDHFKDVNDVLGHNKGDALLKLVALRLQGAVRSGDVVARLGGDEFAILQVDITDPSDAGALASRVLRDLAQPPYDLGTQVEVTGSIGIAFFDRGIAEPEEMIKQADMALYRAKDAGRNQFHFHSEALDVAIIERVTLAADLRLGIERGEFVLHYQPQVEIDTGRITGIEALARWQHPRLGLLQPSHFIPVAEKSGTIFPLGRWVIEQVCRQIHAWRADGLSPPKISLNVSAVQVNGSPDFDVDLVQILRNWNIDPEAIELELTESVLMATSPEHRNIIERLNRLGIAIAIDDFGTGYSSLSYLRTYRVSQIKIAQEFIRNIQAGSGDIAIVRAAISLARELGITVIAEGVETAYQLDLLKEAGCRFVQGYYFSPPLPAGDMAALLQKRVITAHAPDGITPAPTTR